MAIYQINEDIHGAGETQSTDHHSKRTYEIDFIALSNDPLDGPIQVEYMVYREYGIFKGAAYRHGAEEDPLSFCQSIDCHRDHLDGLTWRIRCSYSPYPNGGTSDNPLMQPAKIRASFSVLGQEVAVYDVVSGKPIKNSASDPFCPAPMKDRIFGTLSITQSEANFPDTSVVNTVNASTFVVPGIANGSAGCVRCKNIAAESQYNQQYGWYYDVSRDFEFSPYPWGWQIAIEDMGYYAWTTDDQNYYQITDTYNNPVTIPQPLDGAGHEAPDDQTQPYWLYFNIYQPSEWIYTFRVPGMM